MKTRISFWVLSMLMPLTLVRAEVTECDRLAANPPDPDRVAEGVPRAEVDIDAAIAACRDALAVEPGNARLAYQLGRVSFYAGDSASALKYIDEAADRGYRQAEFVMGALIDNRRQGMPSEVCRVEDYWYRSASKGHVHARVAYVRHVTKGLFETCEIQATPEQLSDLVDVAASGSEEYFLRILVTDLKEDVAAYQQRMQSIK